MRPTERFFEANFYSQVARAWHPNSLAWFTPSTVDEADYGFDTYVDLGGRFFFFQFKHPKTWRTRKKLCLHPGHDYVQAHADHDQMTTLRQWAQHWPPGSFLYVMPALVDWPDYADADIANLLQHTYYFDVISMAQPIAAPTKADGLPRLSGEHQLNLDPQCPKFTVRSDPIDLEAHVFSGLIDQFAVVEDAQAPSDFVATRDGFRELVGGLPRSTVCLLVSSQG